MTAMSWTLTFYVARKFMAAVLIVFGAFLALAASIDLADLFNHASERDMPADVVFAMSLLKLPNIGMKLLPFAVLFGAILAFARLSRTHELVAARAAGVSAWQFLAPPLASAIALGLFTFAALSPISASLLSQFARLEAKYIKGQASQLAVGTTGLWLRQGDAGHQSVIHALKVSEQGTRLGDVIVFLYDGPDRLAGRVDAASAVLRERAWRLENAWVSGPDGRPAAVPAYDLPTDLTPSRIQESFASPDTISFWDLPRFIAAAEDAGFSANRHRLHWYSLLGLPLLFSAMVLLAASFSFRLARMGRIPQLVLAAALSGFAVYFLGDVTQALGISGILPAPLAAMAPAACALLIGLTLLFYEEDG
jgi:lipopolysaccharide export system permease protein